VSCRSRIPQTLSYGPDLVYRLALFTPILFMTAVRLPLAGTDGPDFRAFSGRPRAFAVLLVATEQSQARPPRLLGRHLVTAVLAGEILARLPVTPGPKKCYIAG
jgi:hypothetical protein